MDLFGSLKRYNAEIKETKMRLENVRQELYEIAERKKTAEAELATIQNQITATNIYVDFGQTYIPAQSLDELEQKRAKLQDEMIKELYSGAWKIEHTMLLNGSESKGRALQKAHGDGLMYSLSAYIDSKEKSITLNNYEESKRLIEKRFNQMQKKANAVSILLNKNYIAKRIEILNIKAQIKEATRIRKAQEREALREEQKLIEEAERERKRLKAEREAMDIAFAHALNESEREEIKSKLANLDLRLADIDYRINNPKAGYLYVISSPSLPDMIKIGVTRRLSGPMARVKELSSSSLPFPFKLEAYCFSNNAFELETNIHNYFDAYRVSPNREFFYITVEQAVDVLKNKFNQEVHYGTYEADNESEEE